MNYMNCCEDIGPKSYPVAMSIANLKASVIAQWPKDKNNGPRKVKDVKLINGGRILENKKTLEECRNPLCDLPGGVTTMHVVVQLPLAKKAGKRKKLLEESEQNKCGCVIL